MEKQATIVIQVPAETKTRWVGAAQASGMKLADWIISHVDGPRLADPANWPDPTYKELIAELGGYPEWAAGLGDRAVLALMRGDWTPDKLQDALNDGLDLISIGNVNRRTAQEISRWLRDRRKNAGH